MIWMTLDETVYNDMFLCLDTPLLTQTLFLQQPRPPTSLDPQVVGYKA